jgi:hypothetical protein
MALYGAVIGMLNTMLPFSVISAVSLSDLNQHDIFIKGLGIQHETTQSMDAIKEHFHVCYFIQGRSPYPDIRH